MTEPNDRITGTYWSGVFKENAALSLMEEMKATMPLINDKRVEFVVYKVENTAEFINIDRDKNISAVVKDYFDLPESVIGTYEGIHVIMNVEGFTDNSRDVFRKHKEDALEKLFGLTEPSIDSIFPKEGFV